jgi:predicted alpha/beta-hydrolase family hydrolase
MNAGSGERQFELDSSHGALDATWLIPDNAIAQLVFAHGAGADHRHRSMQSIAGAMADVGIATLRFNFPYMQAGKRRVDGKPVAMESIELAAMHAATEFDLPLFLGGHSFGGRMGSHAVAEGKVDCRGLVFCSYPLHPAKKPARDRAAHLPQIPVPMLFLSGTRDDLADVDLLDGVVRELGPRARIHWLETANHSYAVLKRTRTCSLTVFEEIGQQTREFVDGLI